MQDNDLHPKEPAEEARINSDAMPSPEELAQKGETIKITISLSRTSVVFFKQKAREYHTQYQKMIRRLLDEYSSHHRSP